MNEPTSNPVPFSHDSMKEFIDRTKPALVAALAGTNPAPEVSAKAREAAEEFRVWRAPRGQWEQGSDAEAKLQYVVQRAMDAAVAEERERRCYYQSIVYAVCNHLDYAFGRKLGTGIVCGTKDEPHDEVQREVLLLAKERMDAMSQLAAAQSALEANDAEASHAAGPTAVHVEALQKELAEVRKLYADVANSHTGIAKQLSSERALRQTAQKERDAIEAGRAASEHLRVVNLDGWNQAAQERDSLRAELAQVGKERDAADRRAGAAERNLEFEKDTTRGVSFDVVWEECLTLKAERDSLRAQLAEAQKEKA